MLLWLQHNLGITANTLSWMMSFLNASRLKLQVVRQSSIMVVDSCITTADHVSSTCRTGYFHPCQMRPVIPSLTLHAAKTVVKAFITSCLDYCNSMIYSLTIIQLQRLQLIQNADCSRCKHVTPILRDLHWLPVYQCINFKLALPVCKSVTVSITGGDIPVSRLSICFIRHVSPSSLFSESGHLRVPRTQTWFTDLSFAVAGPWLWNSLPTSLRRTDSELSEFKRLLQTYLFKVADMSSCAENHGQAGVWHRLAEAEPFNGPGLRWWQSDTGRGRERMPRDDYQAPGTKCTSWTEYKPGENEGQGNHSASIITTNSCCTREHGICRKIHLPGKCNI